MGNGTWWIDGRARVGRGVLRVGLGLGLLAGLGGGVVRAQSGAATAPAPAASVAAGSYRIVDTGQDLCFAEKGPIEYPHPGNDYFGQDAEYVGAGPSYKDNLDGTVTDLVTGLMWQKTPDYTKRTQDEAESYAASLRLAGRNDWRLPSIKELFSLADLRGTMTTLTPFIDTKYFDFKYPTASSTSEVGARLIDAQYASSTRYIGTIMTLNVPSAFGFNFADGRIKSYPQAYPKYVRCCRGPAYGQNDFVDNQDGTVTDRATGLTWTKADSPKPMTWAQALSYAEQLSVGGHSDWRVPNVKELQSIVDYSRAPNAMDLTMAGPAIDPVFTCTKAQSWCWTSTTHYESGFAYYVCFGEASCAWKLYNGAKMDAHGAGAVRGDPKSGDPGKFPDGLGPQADEIRIYNYVRCVRGGSPQLITTATPAARAMMVKTAAAVAAAQAAAQSTTATGATTGAKTSTGTTTGTGAASSSGSTTKAPTTFPNAFAPPPGQGSSSRPSGPPSGGPPGGGPPSGGKRPPR